MKKTHPFDIFFRILLMLLPFTTLLTVWTKEQLWISGVGFYKEILLFLMFAIVVWYHITGRHKLKLWRFDILLVAYIVSMLVVSFFTTGIRWIIYGWRYDFEFLLAFWVIFHGAIFLEKPISYYIKIFLISCGSMLFLSWLLKWPLTEDLLLHFGYCGNPSNWQECNGVPPIFHGIDGANVRRFQGILDGPNTMGAMLILFSGVFAYFMRAKKDWYFVSWVILLGLFMMLAYTYSRSAIIGMIIWVVWIVWINLLPMYRKYKWQFIWIITAAILCIYGVFISYGWMNSAIIERGWSTKWHFERMLTSINRFIEHPFGQWLWSSGPAYRYVFSIKPEELASKDHYYIPESWYIQQFVEWWWIGGILFCMIIVYLMLQLFQVHSILGGTFIGIAVMNIFLHTFESSVLSLLLFLLLGLILSEKHPKRIQKI